MCQHNFKNYRLLFSKQNSGNYRTLPSIILELQGVHRHDAGIIASYI